MSSFIRHGSGVYCGTKRGLRGEWAWIVTRATPVACQNRRHWRWELNKLDDGMTCVLRLQNEEKQERRKVPKDIRSLTLNLMAVREQNATQLLSMCLAQIPLLPPSSKTRGYSPLYVASTPSPIPSVQLLMRDRQLLVLRQPCYYSRKKTSS